MRRSSFSLVIALAMLGVGIGCDNNNGTDAGGSHQDGGGDTDSGSDMDAGGSTDGGGGGSDAGPMCTSDDDCDDGDTCNGAETCADGACESGAEADDGTECDADGDSSTRDICLSGSCGAARCGDSFVDETASEECDDGNDVSGDGCDACSYSCHGNADCDDGQACNGTESCSDTTHACESGTALDDDTECAGGTGSCMSGICVPTSCTMDSDCDDGNPCNGAETCVSDSCTTGAALTCDDSDACTTDTCDPSAGSAAAACVNRVIDADLDGHSPSSAGECGDDCDDGNPDVYPGAADICDGIDNNCDGTIDEGGVVTWYADCDADGYAASGARTVSSCARPAAGLSMCSTGGGWTAREPADASTTDCNDSNATAHPGQTMYQTTGMSGAGVPPGGPFDYDCSGTEDLQYDTTGSCEVSGLFACTTTDGWAESVPACGAMADYVSGCTRGLSSCSTTTTSQTQGCI